MKIDQLKAATQPLDIESDRDHSALEREYFDYYDINFSAKLTQVNHYFGYLDCDKYRIACHYFKNAGATRTVFIVHGYTDHVGLYGKLINYFLHRGCCVVAMDLPGHGLSSGAAISIDSFGEYGIVLRHCLEYFYKKAPSPWHAVGQSMGGAIFMDYLLSQQLDEQTGPFDKVLLLAPLVRPTGWGMIKSLHWVLRGWVPSIKRKFSDESHDQAFNEFQRNKDPLQARRLPIKWVTAMIQWEKRFHDLSWGDNAILVLQGDADGTVDWKHNQSVIAQKFPKSRFMPIKGAKHHLARESDEYFQRVTQAADIYFERRRSPRD